MHHRWTAIGEADITPAQADDWADATDEVVDTALEVTVTEVRCAVCLASHPDTTSHCPGTTETLAHLWRMILTAPVDDDVEDALATTRPHSVAVFCVLCGQVPDDAEAECPERALWGREALDVPDDLSGLDDA